MNTFVKTIGPNSISSEFLKSLNGLTLLTEKEIELFSILIDIELSLIKTKTKHSSIDNAKVRKALMEMTGVTKDNLSRYMRKFREKGLLVSDGVNSKINKALIPNVIGGKTVQVSMILKIKEDVQ